MTAIYLFFLQCIKPLNLTIKLDIDSLFSNIFSRNSLKLLQYTTTFCPNTLEIVVMRKPLESS